MKFRKLLMTGSEGIIGQILSEPISSAFELYKLDRVDNEEKRYFKCDISKYDVLHSTIQKIAPLDCIIHLAADSRVEAPWESILLNNIIGTRNVYEVARTNGVKKVIFASSNHVTGGYEGIPPRLHQEKNPRTITTKDVIRPDSYYGSSKAFGEALARQFFELFNIRSICLRIGTVLKDDDPTLNQRFLKTWLSHRDLIQLINKSIVSNIDFGIYYSISNNKGNFWDISKAEKELGYKPEDDAFLRSKS